MSTIPEEFREDVMTLVAHGLGRYSVEVADALDRLVACLPEPEPTFTDEEALAFDRAMWPNTPHPNVTMGRKHLTTLAKAGWTAPKALCPPPSPALVELVEAAREIGRWGNQRLRAAVAAYDEQEG